jgi:hypothetical protein
MAKPIDERITEAKEKISQYENQMKRLIQKQKETDRKARTRRLIERGAILESFLTAPETMSNDEVRDILAQWRTHHAE